MATFCTKCGNEIKDDARFCVVCGSPAPVGNAPAGSATADTPLVGFSNRVNDPEISAAVKKMRSSSKLFAFILIPLPLIALLVYSGVSDSMEISKGILYGAIISGIFLVVSLVSFIKERASSTYDATVIKKKHYTRDRKGEARSEEYITVVRTDSGKKKKIREYGGRTFAYGYLNEGDRFRYHPQFAFPYELYDKRHAPCIYCVACQTQNPLSADRCEHCGTPLLK